MYRAITWVALARGISTDDERAITALAEETVIQVLPPDVQDGRQFTVRVNAEDITWRLREESVDLNVSRVSAYPGVRRAMSSQQRRIGQAGRVVMVGRDIGTVVLPEANVKIFLDATEEERARRRYRERVQRGEQVELASVLREIRHRDEIDTHRAIAPLKKAEDAVYVDSTHMSISQVQARVLEIIEEKASAVKQMDTQ